MTSNDLAKPDTNREFTVIRTSNNRNKNILKAGSLHESIEINDDFSDEILHNLNLQMGLALQIISNVKSARSDTIQDIKEFNSQSLTTQGKKGEQLVCIMPAFKKAFDFIGDDIVELSTENDSLKNHLGDYDQKWLYESEANLLKQMDVEKGFYLFMSRMKKQMNTNE